MQHLIQNEHLVRQADLISHEKQTLGITMVGAGAIGSFATIALVKAGFYNLKVYDFDEVSIENMSCQGYRFKDIGKPKVAALADIVKDFTNVDLEICPQKWEASVNENPIVVVAVDSMEARRKIFEDIKAKCFNVRYIIDPRMGAEVAAMYCMDPHGEAQSYEKTLYSDQEAVQERCTAKATIYTANMLAGLVVKCIKNIAVGENYPRNTQWNIKDDEFQAWKNK